jgi:transaldolase
VESLIGKATITIPTGTLAAFEDHGKVEDTLPGNLADAADVMTTLAGRGTDFADVNRTLENEAIRKFNASLENLPGSLAGRRS